MTDGLLIALGVLLMLLGLAGCLLPALPGPPLAYAGLLALHLTARVAFSARTLAFGLALMVAVQVADTVVPAVGTRRWGGTRWGVWGCVLGSLAGLVFSLRSDLSRALFWARCAANCWAEGTDRPP